MDIDMGYDLVSSMESSIKPQDESMSVGLIILIVCCILCLSSSGTSYYLLSSESSKLSGDDSTPCEKKGFTPFPFNPDKYVCPYGRGVACSSYEEGGYNLLFCPFNYAFIADEPKGTRSKIFKLIMTMSNTKEDIFNSQYFIKRDFRKNTSIFCSKDMKSCQDFLPERNIDMTMPNKNRYIKIKSGNLIKLSSSQEVDKEGKPYTDYYAYVIYDLIVTFSVGVGLAISGKSDDSGESLPITVRTLSQLKGALNRMETYYLETLANTRTLSAQEKPPYDFKVNNLSKSIREPTKQADQNIAQKYSLVCFFYKLEDLGSLVKLFQDTFVQYIDKEIWVEYLNEIKEKLNTEVTMFEFIMYLTLSNYLDELNYKFILNKNPN